MKLVRHTFKINGVSPLMMHNPAGTMKLDEGGIAGGQRKVLPPDQEAELGTYWLPNGNLYGPSAGLRNAILEAGKGRKIGKPKKSLSMVLAGAAFTVDDQCHLIHPKTGKPLKDIEIDTRRVVNPSTKGAYLYSRPVVKEWSTLITFEVDEDLIDAGVVLEVLNLAGSIIGWLCFRPQKKGSFGRFTAEMAKKS